MKTQIPSRSGKVSLDHLKDITRDQWSEGGVLSTQSPVLYSTFIGEFKYDFLWKPKPDSNRIFVLFSGDAMRKKNDPPVFQRWSWADFFPGHCIFFSDPVLYMSRDIGLAWYSGNEKTDVLKVIANILSEISQGIKVKDSNIYAYGSSGGGFAALRLLQFLPQIGAIAVNPQTSICRYEYKSVERYLNLCFGGRDRKAAIRDFPFRMSLIESAKVFRGKRIALIQNVMDTHHFNDHYKPFCAALGAGIDDSTSDGSILRLLFEHVDGHRKAETPEVFGEIMDRIEGGRF